MRSQACEIATSACLGAALVAIAFFGFFFACKAIPNPFMPPGPSYMSALQRDCYAQAGMVRRQEAPHTWAQWAVYIPCIWRNM